jgi:hypothetical protein
MEDDSKDKRLDELFAAARRAESFDANMEYGFETRVMSRIRAKREGRMPVFTWAWRLIPVFLSVVVLLGIWISASEPPQLTDLSDIARIGNGEAMLVASLAGE